MLLIIGGYLQGYNGEVSMIDAKYGNSSLLFLINAASSFGFIFLFFSFNKCVPFLEFFGKNSLTVLCTHVFYIEAFWILNSQIFHLPLGSVDARIFALAVILLEVPTILIINRCFPWLVGQKRKN